MTQRPGCTLFATLPTNSIIKAMSVDAAGNLMATTEDGETYRIDPAGNVCRIAPASNRVH